MRVSEDDKTHMVPNFMTASTENINRISSQLYEKMYIKAYSDSVSRCASVKSDFDALCDN
jgi:hypothetical protein